MIIPKGVNDLIELNNNPDFTKSETVAKEVLELIKNKNSDYGGVMLVEGKIGIATRILEKAFRLYNLCKKEIKGESAKTPEAKEETIKDLLGYCLLWFAYFE